MRYSLPLTGIAAGVLLATTVQANEPLNVEIHKVSADGVEDQNSSCEPAENDSGEMTAALSAGGHYDPEEAGTHQGPYGDGHLGDLPVLTVNGDGEANLPVLAPRLSMEDMPGRSLMIHAGGDTYADEPHLGGGGARMACGVVSS